MDINIDHMCGYIDGFKDATDLIFKRLSEVKNDKMR